MLRCLQLEAHGYQVSVTELVGWEQSMKNELIIAQYKDFPRRKPAERLTEMLERIGLQELKDRFFCLRILWPPPSSREQRPDRDARRDVPRCSN